MVLDLIWDSYNLRARLAPALLVLFPLGLGLGPWIAPEPGLTAVLTGLGGASGLALLLAQFGRDWGKKREPTLFAAWGGKPSTQMLSYRATSLNPLTLACYHTILGALRPALRLPRSREEELRDAESADAVYESCTDFLREATRNKKAFPLVWEENVNYGFRRNLWAMKPAGIVAAVLGAAACSIRALGGLLRSGALDPVPTLYAIISGSMLLLWLAVITPGWVRPVAFAYAQRLLAACETLGRPSPESGHGSIVL